MAKVKFVELESKRFMRAKELAEFLSCGISTIWRWSKEGKLNPICISSKITLFDIEDVNKMLAKGA